LILQRKVLYLGISDAPAWVVAQANEYALAYGKTPFSIYQGLWNVMQRYDSGMFRIQHNIEFSIAETLKEKSCPWLGRMAWLLHL
jgi:aryl-alcohol dehydrogenase-like predicted oxidoreductase